MGLNVTETKSHYTKEQGAATQSWLIFCCVYLQNYLSGKSEKCDGRNLLNIRYLVFEYRYIFAQYIGHITGSNIMECPILIYPDAKPFRARP